MKALVIDPWLSSPGIISCHHGPCPLSSGVSSLHHGVSFIKNVVVTFHFCFTFSSLRSGTITPLSRNLPVHRFFWAYLTPVALSPHWSHMGDCVFTYVSSAGQPAPQGQIQDVSVWYTSVHPRSLPPAPRPWAPGWEQSGRWGNIWWMNKLTN